MNVEQKYEMASNKKDKAEDDEELIKIACVTG